MNPSQTHCDFCGAKSRCCTMYLDAKSNRKPLGFYADLQVSLCRTCLVNAAQVIPDIPPDDIRHDLNHQPRRQEQ